MVNDFYCGIKKDNLKRRMGNMKECVEAGEIRYFGIKQVDARLLEAVGAEKKKITSNKIWIKLVGIRAKIKKLEIDVKYIKDDKKKKLAIKELSEAKITKRKILKEFNDLKKKEENEALMKTKSKLGSKSKSGSKSKAKPKTTQTKSGSKKTSVKSKSGSKKKQSRTLSKKTKSASKKSRKM